MQGPLTQSCLPSSVFTIFNHVYEYSPCGLSIRWGANLATRLVVFTSLHIGHEVRPNTIGSGTAMPALNRRPANYSLCDLEKVA